MKKIVLNGKWNGKGVNPLTKETIEFNEAIVPGCNLNDIVNLSCKGEDIFYRDNLEKYQKYENFNYIYTKKFDVEKTDGKIFKIKQK